MRTVTILVTVMAANSQFSMAIHILALLAGAGEENVKSKLIARSVNTNAVVIRRILSHLNHAGLVVSQTGASGGTRRGSAARPASAGRHGKGSPRATAGARRRGRV